MPLTDPPIRAALISEVVPTLVEGDAEALTVHEFGLCQHRARVDVAVFNGHMHGFEIKSDRDSLARLSGQVEVYSAVLDRVTIVTGYKHIEHALVDVPSWWGVIEARSSGREVVLCEHRRAQQNPGLSATMLASMLWHEEAIRLLDTRDAATGVRSKSLYFVCERLVETFSVEELSREVRLAVKARTWTEQSVSASGARIVRQPLQQCGG